MPTHDPEDLGGRRAADKIAAALSAETLSYLLGDLKEDLTELKVMMRDGFAESRRQHAEHGKRIQALEDFRTRSEERDRNLARAEGQFVIRLPMLALILTFLGIVVGVVLAVTGTAG